MGRIAGPGIPVRKRGRPPKQRTVGGDNTNSVPKPNPTVSPLQQQQQRRGSNVSQNAQQPLPQQAVNIQQSHFPRRFPRVSGYYQIKEVPTQYSNDDKVYESSRPIPLAMSLDVPFRTQLEIDKNQILYYDAGEIRVCCCS